MSIKREIERKNLQYSFNIYLLNEELKENIDLLSLNEEEKKYFISNIIPKIKLLKKLEENKKKWKK